ncbi:MAG TPA: hypothetical protein VM802_13425 [Chitinophaga sp.]|uniref:hypothetical protein n=1 Tax=Chitinophaga sp. TaxID=1869181 RepID=UPI002CBF9C7E|nr:hypothetical protein [Chitinophaga sp.]HVI45869.1 hypothetical protein [Chitinophaga sp.]
MENKKDLASTYNLHSFVMAVVPAYVFPALMSFIAGFLLQQTDLMQASYSTIGLSSLLSTVFSFIILWQLDLGRILVQKKRIRALLVILLMTGIGALCVSILKLPSERFNITFSAFLGAAILTIRQLVKDYKNEKK